MLAIFVTCNYSCITDAHNLKSRTWGCTFLHRVRKTGRLLLPSHFPLAQCFRNLLWHYSRHPSCISPSFSSSKSKLIFSKDNLNLHFSPLSILASIFAVCTMKLIVQWSLHFVAFGSYVKVITIISVKYLGHSPVSCVWLVSCVTILRPFSSNVLSTSPGTSSSPVTLLSLVSPTVCLV